MSNELSTVINFCLRQAQSAPVPDRVELYRGLAEFCGSPALSAEFCAIARDLELAENRCREFALNFELRDGSQPKRPHLPPAP